MFGVIFDEILQTTPNFYELERSRQQAVIDAKIAEYQGQTTGNVFSMISNDEGGTA
jgi:hypothetical protein